MVDMEHMSWTNDAFFMHCLPVRRNMIVTDDVIEASTSLVDIAAGLIIAEQVFALPGLGRLLLTSIGSRDYPVAQIIVVLIAFVVVFMNYLADIITQYVDPRVRLSR